MTEKRHSDIQRFAGDRRYDLNGYLNYLFEQSEAGISLIKRKRAEKGE